MKEQNKTIREQLEAYPEQFELREDAPARASALTETLYGSQKRKRRRIPVFAASFAMVLVVGISVGVGLYLNAGNVYNGGELPDYGVEQVDVWLQKEGLDCRYFREEQFEEGEAAIQNIAYYEEKTGRIAFLKQNVLCNKEDPYAAIDLYVVFPRIRYPMLSQYYLLTEHTSVLGMTVWYQIKEKDGLHVIDARFEDNGCGYCMSLTVPGGLEYLESYIGILFGR